MSWYRKDDGKIITDEEFQSDCLNCSCFCSEGTISVPCDGDRADCPYFNEVDTFEYDNHIRIKAIEEFAEVLRQECLNNVYHEVWLHTMLRIAGDLKKKGV